MSGTPYLGFVQLEQREEGLCSAKTYFTSASSLKYQCFNNRILRLIFLTSVFLH